MGLAGPACRLARCDLRRRGETLR